MLSELCGDEIAHLVILHPAGAKAAPELESVAGALSHACPRCTEPLEAFAEIALYDRLNSTRSAWGLAAPGITCLVIVDITQFPDAEAMTEAIDRFFPHVSVVEFDRSARTSWRLLSHGSSRSRDESNHPFRRQKAAGGELMNEQTGRAMPGMPPALRLVDQRDGDGRDLLAGKVDGSPDSRAKRAAPLIPAATARGEPPPEDSAESDLDNETTPSVTRDEIAMLLRGDLDDDDATGARREAAP